MPKFLQMFQNEVLPLSAFYSFDLFKNEEFRCFQGRSYNIYQLLPPSNRG